MLSENIVRTAFMEWFWWCCSHLKVTVFMLLLHDNVSVFFFFFSLLLNLPVPVLLWPRFIAPTEFPSTIHDTYTQPYGLASQLINMNSRTHTLNQRAVFGGGSTLDSIHHDSALIAVRASSSARVYSLPLFSSFHTFFLSRSLCCRCKYRCRYRCCIST